MLRKSRQPVALSGILLFLAGSVACVLSAVPASLALLRDIRPLAAVAYPALVTGALLLLVGTLLVTLDLVFLLPAKRARDEVPDAPVSDPALTVVLTAFNDEQSIGDAVRDFRAHPLVRRVLVVDNNSADRTAEHAAAAGATVVHESRQGYGQCVYRALSEGVRHEDCQVTLLCEGDRTFRARDIDKFVAYLPHADIVNGTRIVEQLRSPRTQLTTFMYYGNFFVGKLLELKHLGQGTFTDVGTTYKACRNTALRRILPYLNPAVNLEFNAHFMDVALERGLKMVECPITFYGRVGQSKGANVSNSRALRVGLRMIAGILFGWRRP